MKKKETFGLCLSALFEDACRFSVYLGAHHRRYFMCAGIWAADSGGQHGNMFSLLAEGVDVWTLEGLRASGLTHGQLFQNGWRCGTQIMLGPNKCSKYLVMLKQQDCYVSKGTSNKASWADAVYSVFVCKTDTNKLDTNAGAFETQTICAVLKELLQG